MRRLLIMLCCWLPWAPVLAQETDFVMPEIPKLSVTLEPTDVASKGGFVQGQILLKVQVASKHAFEKLHLDLPDIAAEVIQIKQPRTRKVRSYVGEGHVFETTLAIFPSNSGILEIPPVAVSGAVEPETGREPEFADRSEAVRLEIAGIHPGYRDPWWLVSDRVILSETWSKPIEALRVGDTVRREVTAVAFGVTAARMPALESGRARGISVVEAGGSATTDRSPDGVVATVKRAWDLKIEAGGVAYISPVGITYWHPGERAERTASLAGKRIEPLPPDRSALAAALLREAREEQGKVRTMAIVLAVLAVVPLAILGVALLVLAWPTTADRRLAIACASAAKPAELYRAVSLWATASDVDLRSVSTATAPSYDQLMVEAYSARAARVDRSNLVDELTRLSRRKRFQKLSAMSLRSVTWMLGPRLELDSPEL